MPRHQQIQEELQVRLTVQDILARNLRVPQVGRRRWWQWTRTPEATPPWPGIRLNLTGALLIDFTLQSCRLDQADFCGAQFTGDAYFGGARVSLGAVARPPGWTMRPAQPYEGDDPDYQYLVRVEDVAAEKDVNKRNGYF